MLSAGEYDYNRSGNPTRTVLERQMADLEVGSCGAERGGRMHLLMPAKALRASAYIPGARLLSVHVLLVHGLVHVAKPKRRLAAACRRAPIARLRLQAAWRRWQR